MTDWRCDNCGTHIHTDIPRGPCPICFPPPPRIGPPTLLEHVLVGRWDAADLVRTLERWDDCNKETP